MSTKRITAVWEYSKQNKIKLLILLSMADRADDDGFCWPSRKDIAERSRCTSRYVSAAIKELEADGEIIIRERRGKSSQYIVCTGMSKEEKEAAIRRRFGNSFLLDYKDPGKLQQDRGGKPQQDHPGTPRLVEPSFEPSIESSSGDDDFSIAVTAYEKYVGPIYPGMADKIETHIEVWNEQRQKVPDNHVNKNISGGVAFADALHDAVDNDATNKYTYARAILANWIKHGYKTDPRKRKDTGDNLEYA